MFGKIFITQMRNCPTAMSLLVDTAGLEFESWVWKRYFQSFSLGLGPTVLVLVMGCCNFESRIH